MRKFISILFALVLVISFSLVTAAPVAAATATFNVVPFTLDTATGTAAWSTDAAHTGSWGVNIGTDTAGSVGRVIFDWNQNLSTITNMAYWYNLQAGNGSPNWDSGPYVVLALDTTNDTSADTWVVHHMFAMSPGTGTWLKWELADGPIDSQYMVTGNGTAMWHVAGATTIANASWAEVVTQFGSDTVLEIKVAVGDWASDIETRHWVDDIAINGTIYYGKIQDAIDSAAASDTVLVYPGEYNEQVYINKANLTVESSAGKATTFIDGTGVTDANLISGHGALVWLQKDGITLEGFTVRDYPDGWGNGGVVFIQGWNGTTVDDITGCTVTENTITVSNTNTGKNGIVVSGGADSNTVSDNTITVTNQGGDAIIISGTAGNDTTGNQITGNIIASMKYGVSICTDSWTNQRNFPGTVISGNTISGGTNGIGILYATGTSGSHIVIQENTISGVTTGEGEGIEVYYGGYVDIFRNIVQGNTTGIQVTYSTDIVANYNSITGNTGVTTGFDAANNTVDVDATKNWWGDAAGPTVATNPYNAWTNGDTVTEDNVDYIPWLISTTLVANEWNIYSTPIALDSSCDTLAEALAIWGSSHVDAAFYFDSSASPPAWEIASSLTPLQAVYLHTTAADTIDVWFSSSYTAPPSRTMYQGWNLVGPAHLGGQSVYEGPPSGQYGKNVDVALISAYYATGVAQDLWGYSQVISPTLNGIYWEYIRGQNAGFRLFIPTKGYWVYMVNQGGLSGSTETPVREVTPPQP